MENFKSYLESNISNHSISVRDPSNEVFAELEKIANSFNVGVIKNSFPWIDVVHGGEVQMYTFIKIDQKTWSKIKTRKFIKDLKKDGRIHSMR
jgi:hypothetical protein